MKIIDSVIEAYSYHFSSLMEELAVPGAIFLNEIVVHCSEQSSILVKHLKSWSCREYRLVAKQVPQSFRKYRKKQVPRRRACWSGRQFSLLLWVDQTHIWSRWGRSPGTPWSWLSVFWILDPDYLLFFWILDPDYLLFFLILDPDYVFLSDPSPIIGYACQ